jgi:hypothetical protein
MFSTYRVCYSTVTATSIMILLDAFFSFLSIFHKEVASLAHFVIVSNVPSRAAFTWPIIIRAYSPNVIKKIKRKHSKSQWPIITLRCTKNY